MYWQPWFALALEVVFLISMCVLAYLALDALRARLAKSNPWFNRNPSFDRTSDAEFLVNRCSLVVSVLTFLVVRWCVVNPYYVPPTFGGIALVEEGKVVPMPNGVWRSSHSNARVVHDIQGSQTVTQKYDTVAKFADGHYGIVHLVVRGEVVDQSAYYGDVSRTNRAELERAAKWSAIRLMTDPDLLRLASVARDEPRYSEARAALDAILKDRYSATAEGIELRVDSFSVVVVGD